ncbi:MAG: thioredoxin family protein [Treponema sp.]|jgi:small redox-active disulfide protein 2|nr:thioredoxin family protein [Treponema sp.]
MEEKTTNFTAVSGTDGGNRIKVLGGGCKKCEALKKASEEALAAKGEKPEVDYITDMASIASYGVMSTPALIVDGKIVSMGRVLTKEQVETYL